MAKRVRQNWHRVVPTAIKHATRLCLDHALTVKGLSVDQVAELIGLNSTDTLYKYCANGRMPSILIRPFEHVCGIDYISRYLAASNNKLLVTIPSGRKLKAKDLIEIQTGFNTAINLLAEFNNGGAVSAEEVLGALTATMVDIAYQRENVTKQDVPELPLFGEGSLD